MAYPFSTSLAAPLILVGVCRIGFASKILKRLGRYSLEMYLIHYQIMVCLFSRYDVTDPWLLFVCTFALTLAASMFARHTADHVIRRYNRKVDAVPVE